VDRLDEQRIDGLGRFVHLRSHVLPARQFRQHLGGWRVFQRAAPHRLTVRLQLTREPGDSRRMPLLVRQHAQVTEHDVQVPQRTKPAAQAARDAPERLAGFVRQDGAE
jgi:hypothetical protein